MTQQKQGIHRSTANSMAGRRMISPGRNPQEHLLTKEQKDWNAQVEAKKQAKKQRKILL